MAKRIFVGNLAFSATEDEVRALFEKHGAVLSVSLITDRATGRPRGFGFVEMEPADADKAIKALEGVELAAAVSTSAKPANARAAATTASALVHISERPWHRTTGGRRAVGAGEVF